MSNRPRRAMDFATLLYRQLPAVYRECDNTRAADDRSLEPGDLARLCDSWGDLLDALYRSILQRYYDIFPQADGGPDAERMTRACQPWVLPYLAQLLDVRLHSPLESGRRAEIGRAIAWRQRKGTPLAIEDIADQVAGMEVELREGWRKLAVTPRAGFTLLPESVFGEADGSYPARFRLRRAEHLGLPAGTVDFRRASRAVLADARRDRRAHEDPHLGLGVVTSERDDPPSSRGAQGPLSERTPRASRRAGRPPSSGTALQTSPSAHR